MGDESVCSEDNLGLLSGQQMEASLDDHAILGVLVLGGEASGVSRLSLVAVRCSLLQRRTVMIRITFREEHFRSSNMTSSGRIE